MIDAGRPMRALVVHAPGPDRRTDRLAAAAARALAGGAHDVVTLDLGGFDPVMSAEERRAYHGPRPVVDETVATHAEHLRSADALVFVYPTGRVGPPATLKGWLDRVMVPGVAFHFGPDGAVVGDLGHVRRLVGISTYRESRARVAGLGDVGRRTIMRALGLLCGWRCHRKWLGLYGADGSGPVAWEAFVDRIELRLGRL
jgi:NAD(P)H dehydrogenase (quinone)